MDNNKLFQKEINTIFSYLAKLYSDFPSQDNINFINNLQEYRDDAINFSNLILETDKEDESW